MSRPVDMSSKSSIVRQPYRRRYYMLEESKSENTRKKYNKAVRDFLKWCVDQGEVFEDMDELDEVLTDYIHHIYESDEGRGKANNTYYGLVMQLPILKKNMPTALLCIKAFAKLQPSVSYPPLTWDLTVAIAVQMARHNQRLCAIGTLLGFDCLLRIGELTSLRKTDVADTGDPRMNSEYKGMSLRIRKAKTGLNQFVRVIDRSVQRLIREVVANTKRDDLLFDVTAAKYRALFKRVCRELGLSPLYVPHSLRHGGATRLHMNGMHLEDILMRGRWESTKSARRYVQAGRSLLMAVDVPSHIAALGKTLASDVDLALSLPQLH